MTAATQLRMVVVGAGIMGRHVARAAAVHPGIALVGIVDADGDRAHTVAAEHGIRVFPDIASVDADAVYLGSPSTLHADHAVEALDAGLDVLVDKPMALTAAEGDRIGAAVMASGRALMVGFSYRFRAEWRAAADWVADGRIGDVNLVSDLIVEAAEGTPAWYGRPQDGGGVLQLQAHHCMDRIAWVIGEPLEVTSASGLAADWTDVASHALIQARAAEGAVVSVALGFATGYSDVGTARFLVHGSEGQVVIDSLARTATVTGRGGTETVDATNDDWLERELTAFVERCAHRAADDARHPGWREGRAAAAAVEKAVELAVAELPPAASRERTKRAS